jgi:hypothetical protein
MLQKELLTQRNYAAIGEEIGLEKANAFVKAYQEAYPGEVSGYGLGRNIIEQILAQPGVVGMRFHYGLNDEGQKTLVYFGMDANGKDVVTQTMVTENGVIMSEDAIAADVVWIFLR